MKLLQNFRSPLVGSFHTEGAVPLIYTFNASKPFYFIKMVFVVWFTLIVQVTVLLFTHFLTRTWRYLTNYSMFTCIRRRFPLNVLKYTHVIVSLIKSMFSGFIYLQPNTTCSKMITKHISIVRFRITGVHLNILKRKIGPIKSKQTVIWQITWNPTMVKLCDCLCSLRVLQMISHKLNL